MGFFKWSWYHVTSETSDKLIDKCRCSDTLCLLSLGIFWDNNIQYMYSIACAWNIPSSIMILLIAWRIVGIRPHPMLERFSIQSLFNCDLCMYCIFYCTVAYIYVIFTGLKPTFWLSRPLFGISLIHASIIAVVLSLMKPLFQLNIISGSVQTEMCFFYGLYSWIPQSKMSQL